MKVTISKAYDLQSMQEELRKAFPDYTVFPRGNKVIVVKKTNWVGANIIIGKPEHVRVMEGFPNMGSQFMVLLLILIGLLPGLIAMLLITKKQKVVRDQVGAFVKKHYNTTADLSQNKDLLDN
jgi:hypothetical protein